MYIYNYVYIYIYTIYVRVSVMYIHHAGPMATRVLHVVDHEQKPGRHGKHLTRWKLGGTPRDGPGNSFLSIPTEKYHWNPLGVAWISVNKLLRWALWRTQKPTETQDLRISFDVQPTLDQVSHIINQLVETGGLNIIFHIFKHGISGVFFALPHSKKWWVSEFGSRRSSHRHHRD